MTSLYSDTVYQTLTALKFNYSNFHGRILKSKENFRIKINLNGIFSKGVNYIFSSSLKVIYI